MTTSVERREKQRLLWTVAIIAGVVGLLTGTAGSALMNAGASDDDAQLAAAQVDVNANRCQRDQTCEMNGALIDGKLAIDNFLTPDTVIITTVDQNDLVLATESQTVNDVIVNDNLKVTHDVSSIAYLATLGYVIGNSFIDSDSKGFLGVDVEGDPNELMLLGTENSNLRIGTSNPIGEIRIGEEGNDVVFSALADGSNDEYFLCMKGSGVIIKKLTACEGVQ